MSRKRKLIRASWGVILLVAAACASYPSRAPSSADSFRSYLAELPKPALYYSNDAAFAARLKLLDFAPAGSRALISTFVFDNGVVVRELSTHVCAAARRGVNVRLLVDSKSGGKAGVPDTFNKSDDIRLVEEMYQYMANCGATIYVHNYLRNYIDVFGQRLPNIFLDPKQNGKSFGVFEALTILHRINYLLDKTSALVRDEASRLGLKCDPAPILNHLKSFAMEFMNLVKASQGPVDPVKGGAPQGLEESRQTLERLYRKIVLDPFWDQVNAAQLTQLVAAASERFKRDPELGQLWRELRRFNRINHRKLFLVEAPGGQSGCLFLGGRNLGDSYLHDADGEFLDGDALLCRHQSASFDPLFAAAARSFENLIQDRSDPILGAAGDNVVVQLQPDLGYQYKLLKFPKDFPEAAAPNARIVTKAGDPKGLLPARTWSDAHAIEPTQWLGEARNWRLLETGWDPTKDEVQAELLKRIRAEPREIYIETPYAEFAPDLRAALEDALRRGVHITIITNSFFITDGYSKVIRIMMAHWIEKTRHDYPEHFEVSYVTFGGSRMTHFKGAAFSCQKTPEGTARVFLIGSHNFDPRSGRSDKDHALAWEEPTKGCETLLNSSLVSGRLALYANVTAARKLNALENYPDILEELEQVGDRYDPKSGDTRILANALKNVFYVWTPQGFKVNQGEKTLRLLKLLDEGGLHDLIGRIF